MSKLMPDTYEACGHDNAIEGFWFAAGEGTRAPRLGKYMAESGRPTRSWNPPAGKAPNAP